MKIKLSKSQWEAIGLRAGWIKNDLSVEAKKKKQYEHSPKEHGFIDECIEKNPDVGDPGAYCASIVDKVKGTTKWRKGPKEDKKDKKD
jgi:hypothetical protein